MKDLLLSIRPKWVEKICHEIGKDKNDKPIYEKEIEVRKSKPQEVPFKAYIYCTKASGDYYILGKHNKKGVYTRLDGKVIGECVIDKVYEWECKNRLELVGELGLPTWRASYMIFVDNLEKTCLTYDDLWEYGKGKTLYGWHISDLKIYDKPRELNSLTPFCKYKGEFCECCQHYVEAFGGCCKTLKRPPQSYMYVEKVEE